MKNLSLFYNNSNHRGPGKVVQNLKKGLEQMKIVSTDNQLSQNNVNGVLQLHSVLNQNNVEIKNFILGPNIFVLPYENKNVCKIYNRFIVPSKWILDKYREFSELDHATIDIWAVGIETEKWQSIKRETDIFKCLLYYKNRSHQDLGVVKKLLNKYNIEYKELHYGMYDENELLNYCKWANFGILLTNTESQGIAYMEMLSTNLPLFVFNKPTWNYDGRYKVVSATSVPYFDNRCGEIVENINLIKFEEFLHNLKKEKYSPSQYIAENYTLEKCARNYINLF